jgi:hypothetical protein
MKTRSIIPTPTEIEWANEIKEDKNKEIKTLKITLDNPIYEEEVTYDMLGVDGGATSEEICEAVRLHVGLEWEEI